MPVTPLRQTLADILSWDQARGKPPLANELGLPAEEEQRLLGQG
jgi:hypothetical protein